MLIYKIDRETLRAKYPGSVTCIEKLGMLFIFNEWDNCNLDMVHEFLSNGFQKEGKLCSSSGKQYAF